MHFQSFAAMECSLLTPCDIASPVNECAGCGMTCMVSNGAGNTPFGVRLFPSTGYCFPGVGEGSVYDNACTAKGDNK